MGLLSRFGDEETATVGFGQRVTLQEIGLAFEQVGNIEHDAVPAFFDRCSVLMFFFHKMGKFCAIF